MKRFLTSVLAVATLALGLLAFTASPAAAAQPCWRTVILDWSHDHQIDTSYPIHCYREALRNAPEDLVMYSDLPAELGRAMQQALRYQTGASNSRSARSIQSGVADARKMVRQSKAHTGPIRRALDAIGPTEARSIPIPMIVLAGIALLLVAIGVAGMVARRVQARRVPPSS